MAFIFLPRYLTGAFTLLCLLRALDPVTVPVGDSFDVPPTPLRSRWMPLAAALMR